MAAKKPAAPKTTARDLLTPEAGPILATLRDQPRAVAHLRKAITQGRIPSAYLFLGPHNIGKRTTALALAKALNCEAINAESSSVSEAINTEASPSDSSAFNGCHGGGGQACSACRQIDAQWHPDVETIRPDGRFIKIAQIREVIDKLGLNPFHARKRVIVVSQAERMNPEAANAFLKTLEEPPHNTLIVLCAEDATFLPETIASRCVPLRFGLLSDATVREGLAKDWPLDEGALDFMVRFARGRLRPDLASKAGRWMEIRQHAIQWLIGLDKPLFAQISEEAARWGGSDDWQFVLEWLEGWFRDVALLAGGLHPGGGHDPSAEHDPPGSPSAAAGELLLNRDRIDALIQCAERMTPKDVERHYRTVLETRDGILLNANKALASEAMWLGFKQSGFKQTGFKQSGSKPMGFKP